MGEVELRVLGALQLSIDSTDMPVSRGKAALLAALALASPNPLAVDRLSRLLWTDEPAQYRKSLQNQVKRVRSDFGADIVETVGSSYRLGPSVVIRDINEFMRPLAADVSDDELRSHLRLWRGQPYAELVAEPEVWLERDRLESRRYALLADLAASLLRSADPVRIQDFIDTHAADLENRAPLSDVLARLRAELLILSRPLQTGRTVLSRAQESVVEAMAASVSAVSSNPSQSNAILLSGAAGSGKTTLVDAFAAEPLAGSTVLRSACTEAPAEAHETISGLLAGLDAPVSDDHQLRLVDQLIDALLSIDHGMVMIVDDFHWATVAIYELVERVGAETPHVVVVLATRDQPAALDALGSSSVERFEAPALDQTALERLTRSLLPSDDSSARAGVTDVAAEILMMTGGAPLFAAKLIEELAAADALTLLDGEWLRRDDHPLPKSLIEVVTRQHGSLPIHARHLVEMIAVLHQVGGEASTAYLDERALRNAGDAEASGLVSSSTSGQWRIHSEVARAVLALLSDGARAELHAVAAERLRLSAPIGAARHALRAAALPSQATRSLVEKAAEFAYTAADYPTAVEMWDHTVQLAIIDDLGLNEIADLAIQRCDAARRAGDERQLEFMTDLISRVRACGDVERMASAIRVICKLGASTDGVPRQEFVEFAEETLQRDLSPTARATVLAATTQLYAVNNYPIARSRFLEAYETALHVDDGDLIRFVLPGAYSSVCEPQDRALRKEVGEQLLSRSLADGDRIAEWEAHHLLWSCAAIRGDGAAMAHHQLSATNLPPTRAEPVKEATVAYMVACEHYLNGLLDRAESAAGRFQTLASAMGPERAEWALAVYGVLLFSISRDQGRLADLEPLLRELHTNQPLITGWQAGLAVSLAERGASSEASDLVTPLIRGGLADLPKDLTHTSMLFVMADAAARVCDPDDCATLLEHLGQYQGTMSWTGTSSFGPIDEVLGALAHRIGDKALATKHFQTAESIGTTNGWRIIEMRAQLAQASLDMDNPGSEQLVRGIFARAYQLNAGAVANQARALLGG